MPLQLFVVHRNDDYTKRLEQENEQNQAEIKKLKDKIHTLEFHYNSLQGLQMQLVDLLRANGIPFRDISGISDPYWR